jgi:hypothetical protein
MGNGVLLARSAALTALLLGGSGCEDRGRPGPVGVGSGVGPLAEITTPQEFDTISRGVTFELGVRIGDTDGVDSFWVAFSEPLMDTLSLSGSGEMTVLGLIDVTLPGPSSLDTLSIDVFAVDLQGDTGLVATRHLIVHP